MKSKLISILTAGALFFSGSTIAQENKDSITNKYSKEKIEHVSYDDLNFKDYSLEPMNKKIKGNIGEVLLEMEKNEVKIPNKMLEHFFDNARLYENNHIGKLFLRNSYNSLEKKEKDYKKYNKFNRGLKKELRKNNKNGSLYRLSAKESLDLVFLTTKKMLDYKKVDRGELEIDGINYNALPFDKKIETGYGDCNIFASLASHLFSNLKNKNKNLDNIYLGHSYYGKMNFHDWNQIYFTDGDKFYISSVDVSRDIEENAIDNSTGFYLSKSKDENVLLFYHNSMSFLGKDKWKELFLDSYKKTKEKMKKDNHSIEFRNRSRIYFHKLENKFE